MSGKRNLAKDLLLRPFVNPHKIHPRAMKVQERMTQPLEDLKYKLQELPENYDYSMPPLGNTEHIPFQISRTHIGNLPVYIKYKQRRNIKRTLVQHITGDINEFKTELSKVVSNAKLHEKVGRIEVTGIHRTSVSLWLRRLGF